MRPKYNKIIFFLILTLTLILFSKHIYNNFFSYRKNFNPQNFSFLYSNSQFNPFPQKRRLIIQDQDLYAYAGWYYLTKGEIDTINIEHPPLGKYLIGLSIFIFNNQNVGQIFWGVLFLVFLFLLCQKIIKNTNLSLLTVLLFSQEKLFKEQLTYSLLDLPLGVFLLIFFLIELKKTPPRLSKPLFEGILLGVIATIKYPSIALIVFITLTAFYFLKKEKMIFKKLTLIFLTASAVFLLTYLPFFVKNPSFTAFLNLQVKALKIHLSHVPEYPKGQVFNVLFFNRWLSWWGKKDFIKTEYWNWFWPLLTVNFSISLLKFRKNLLINLWCCFYLLFLSSRLFFPRYLFILLPFFYLNLMLNLSLLKAIPQK